MSGEQDLAAIVFKAEAGLRLGARVLGEEGIKLYDEYKYRVIFNSV